MVTPLRRTHLRLDMGVLAVSEPAFSFGRKGGEIARGGHDRTQSTDVRLLPSGAWCIAPKQDKPNSAVRSDGPATLRAADFNLAPDMYERPMFRSPTDLTGATVGANVSGTGNYFLVRKITAGGSWAASLSADVSAFPMPVLAEGNDVSKSRKATSKVVYSMYQSWQIKVFVPASQSVNTSQSLFGFGFNAPPSDVAGSTGEYYLSLLYGGEAILYERQTVSGALGLAIAHRWRYAPETRNYGLNVIVRIIPHAAPVAPLMYMLFQIDVSEKPQSTTADIFNGLASPAGGQHNYGSLYAYNLKAALGDNDITGIIRCDMPDDSKNPFQISPLQYPATGTLIDRPFSVPWGPTLASNLQLYWNATLPTGTTVSGKLYDATTNQELTLVTDGSSYKVYQTNVGQPNYYAAYTLTANGNGSLTPFLWNYKCIRDAVLRIPSSAEISIPDNTPLPQVTMVSITGAERDPTHETGSVTIEDIGNNLSYPLTTRAGMRGQLWTQYATDVTKRSVLMDFYVSRADALRKGSGTQAFPSPNWNSYDCRFIGMWQRLKETLTSQIYLLNGDPSTSKPGTLVFNKVTDLCRALIQTAGFSSGEIDIPDSPIPFAGQDGSPGYLDSLQPVLDVVTKFLEDYLGWYLAWCPNSGATGMWRAVIPTPLFATYTNLANFTLAGVANKLAFRPESYGANNWVGTSSTIPTVPIRKKTLHYYPIAPEGNSVYVTGTSSLTFNADGTFRVANEMRNFKSYDSIVDANGLLVITSDPSSADYLGRHVPIYVVKFGLQQAAVDAICRRVFDVACHGYEVFSFQAPLALVVDPNDANQTNPRLLRFNDPVTVTINGTPIQFLVRNCNPSYRRDRVQLAMYELQTPPPNV